MHGAYLGPPIRRMRPRTSLKSEGAVYERLDETNSTGRAAEALGERR